MLKGSCNYMLPYSYRTPWLLFCTLAPGLTLPWREDVPSGFLFIYGFLVIYRRGWRNEPSPSFQGRQINCYWRNARSDKCSDEVSWIITNLFFLAWRVAVLMFFRTYKSARYVRSIDFCWHAFWGKKCLNCKELHDRVIGIEHTEAFQKEKLFSTFVHVKIQYRRKYKLNYCRQTTNKKSSARSGRWSPHMFWLAIPMITDLTCSIPVEESK